MEKAGKITKEQKFAMAKCSDEVMRFSRTVRGGFGSAVKNIGKVGAALAGISFAGITAGFIGMAEATEEYRKAQGKLETAFQAAGYSSEVAQKAYKGFYGILGDVDTATEASQLLAQMTRSQEDVTKWTRIAAGVNGTWGDSLPIEGLIESINETQNVGTVTGNLADALNWAGVQEDDFNAKLAKCSTEAQKNALIMQTLEALYGDAADAFYKNNAALVQARETQDSLSKITAKLGISSLIAKNKVWELLGVAEDGNVRAGSVMEMVVEKVDWFQKKMESIDVSKYAPIIAEAVQKVQTGIGIAWKIISPILEQAVKHADVLIPAVLGVVTAISGVSIVADVAGKVMTFVGTIKSVITTVKAAGGIMSWVASGPIGLIIAGIAAAVVVVVLLIKNFDKVKAVAQTVFGGIKTFITTLVDAFKSLGRQIKDAFWGAFNWVKQKIQPIIDWISDKISKIRSGFEKIGNFFSNLGFGSSANTGSQYSLSANGGKATGTPYFRGGLTRVNEGGRGEIMNLPNGTQIIPHDVAKKQQKANNISVQVTIQGNVIGNRAFMEQTGAYITNKILVAQGVV
nr:MAG TPA: minor tail protein [Caudoviricetes sp.]